MRQFKTWILAIAANEARGVFRKGYGERSWLWNGGAGASDEARADDTLENAEDIGRIRALLNNFRKNRGRP